VGGRGLGGAWGDPCPQQGLDTTPPRLAEAELAPGVVGGEREKELVPTRTRVAPLLARTLVRRERRVMLCTGSFPFFPAPRHRLELQPALESLGGQGIEPQSCDLRSRGCWPREGWGEVPGEEVIVVGQVGDESRLDGRSGAR